MDSPREAYAEGQWAASMEWISSASCPYPLFTKNYELWQRGFSEARQAQAETESGND